MKHKKFTMIVALVLVVALAAGLGIWATGEEKLRIYASDERGYFSYT